MTSEAMTPVPVHVTNTEALAGAASPGRHKVRQVKLLTKNITAAQPIIDLVPYDETRLYIQVQAGGNNVVICTDLSQAQDPDNQVAGVPNPVGLLLTAGNTVPWKIEGCQRMWVVGNTFPSQVTYTSVHESP
jgi:hypothetical protein